jgi:putative PEP-CTERM system TPR-repeat lipoprotein
MPFAQLSEKKSIMIIVKKIVIIFTLLCVISTYASDNTNNEAYEKALTSYYDQKYDETIIHLKNALRKNEAHIPSHLLLAKTLLAQGNGALAETELLDLQSMGVDFNQLITLFAQAYILQDKYRQVIDLIIPGYRGNPIESKILFYRGQAYLGLGQSRSAEDAFTEALLLQPDFALAKLGLAQLYMQNNKFQQAMHYIDEALTTYEPQPNAWILKSVVLQRQGHLNEALVAINKALAISPHHMQAKLNRATLLIAQNNYKAALPDIDYILEKIPTEPRANYLKALINAALGNNEASQQKLNEVIVTLNAIPDEVMKNNPSYYYLAGVTHFQFGNLTDAKNYLKNYLHVKKNDFNTLRLLAIIAMQQEDWQNAKSILTKANIYYPQNAEILTLLGEVSLATDRPESAQRYFEQALVLKPKQLPALLNLLRSEIAQKNYPAVIAKIKTDKILTQAIKDKNAEVLLLLIDAYISTKQYDKALPYASALVKLEDNNSFYHQQYAVALGFAGKITQAREEFTKALAIDANNIEALIHLARMDVVENKNDLAIERLTSALTAAPKNIKLTTALADIYTRINQPKLALTWYEKAYSYDNQNSFVLQKLISSYVTNKLNDKALQVLTGYLNHHTDDIQAQLMLGDLYLMLNQPHKAIEAFQVASIKSNKGSEALIRLAQAQLAVGDRLSAIKSLNKAIALDNQNITPLLMQFSIMLAQNNETRATQLIDRIKQLISTTDSSKKTVIDLLSAKLAMHFNRYKEAEQFYKKVLQQQDDQQAVLGLFQALNYQHKYEQADKVIRRWLKNHPNDVIADIALAESYLNLGKMTEVEDFYQQLLQKYQRLPILLNNAANVLYQAGKKDQALIYAKEAYEKAPKNVAVIDTLAWILTRNGNYQQALPLFREALVFDFDNAEVKYHLAVTLAKQNRLNEARKLLYEAVQSEQNFTEKVQAKKLLTQWLNQ